MWLYYHTFICMLAQQTQNEASLFLVYITAGYNAVVKVRPHSLHTIKKLVAKPKEDHAFHYYVCRKEDLFGITTTHIFVPVVSKHLKVDSNFQNILESFDKDSICIVRIRLEKEDEDSAFINDNAKHALSMYNSDY